MPDTCVRQEPLDYRAGLNVMMAFVRRRRLTSARVAKGPPGNWDGRPSATQNCTGTVTRC
jgi:hypothetical protein